MHLTRHTEEGERCVTARQRCHESHSCSILPDSQLLRLPSGPILTLVPKHLHNSEKTDLLVDDLFSSITLLVFLFR